MPGWITKRIGLVKRVLSLILEKDVVKCLCMISSVIHVERRLRNFSPLVLRKALLALVVNPVKQKKSFEEPLWEVLRVAVVAQAHSGERLKNNPRSGRSDESVH